MFTNYIFGFTIYTNGGDMKITTSITIDENMINKLDIQAEEEMRTRSNLIEVILKMYFMNKKEDDKK